MLDTRLAGTAPADDELPVILRKAQDDERCRQALARLGYAQVRSAYAQHRQAGLDRFNALGHEQLWPTLDFVNDWLKGERRRVVERVRWSFRSPTFCGPRVRRSCSENAK
jgi:hypothetical protein